MITTMRAYGVAPQLMFGKGESVKAEDLLSWLQSKHAALLKKAEKPGEEPPAWKLEEVRTPDEENRLTGYQLIREGFEPIPLTLTGQIKLPVLRAIAALIEHRGNPAKLAQAVNSKDLFTASGTKVTVDQIITWANNNRGSLSLNVSSGRDGVTITRNGKDEAIQLSKSRSDIVSEQTLEALRILVGSELTLDAFAKEIVTRPF